MYKPGRSWAIYKLFWPSILSYQGFICMLRGLARIYCSFALGSSELPGNMLWRKRAVGKIRTNPSATEKSLGHSWGLLRRNHSHLEPFWWFNLKDKLASYDSLHRNCPIIWGGEWRGGIWKWSYARDWGFMGFFFFFFSLPPTNIFTAVDIYWVTCGSTVSQWYSFKDLFTINCAVLK